MVWLPKLHKNVKISTQMNVFIGLFVSFKECSVTNYGFFVCEFTFMNVQFYLRNHYISYTRDLTSLPSKKKKIPHFYSNSKICVQFVTWGNVSILFPKQCKIKILHTLQTALLFKILTRFSTRKFLSRNFVNVPDLWPLLSCQTSGFSFSLLL